MRKQTQPAFASGGSLNTLAQNGTNHLPDTLKKPAIIVKGKGTELGSERVLKGRAKRKIISSKIALSLIGIAIEKEDFERIQSFWNVFHCQNRVYSVDGRLYGKYCKNRECTLCCSIRKAVIINKYLPVLQEWKDPQLVTLTIASCNRRNIENYMKGLLRAFKKINEKYRKRNQRGDDFRLMGIKSLECNFNPAKGTYNPHLHLIVPNKETAEIIKKEWLKKLTKKYAESWCQDIRPVLNLEKGLIEIIKYAGKIFTEPDAQKKTYKKDNSEIYAKALYNIFDALKGLRVFDRFGFNLPKTEKEKIPAKVAGDYFEWLFVPQFFDWQNTENELTLTGFDPPERLVKLLENNIDMERE